MRAYFRCRGKKESKSLTLADEEASLESSCLNKFCHHFNLRMNLFICSNSFWALLLQADPLRTGASLAINMIGQAAYRERRREERSSLQMNPLTVIALLN